MSSIKDKIAKLLAVAHDKGATEHEAATAMGMASRLMLQHGISQDEFRKVEIEVIEGLRAEADHRWMVMTSQGAGMLYGCKPIRYRDRDGDKISYVGRSDNVDAATFTYKWLCDQIETFYKQALPKGLSKGERAEFRRTFKEACAIRVYYRIEALVKEMMANDTMASEALALEAPKAGTALVVVNHRKELEAEVDAFMNAANVRRNTRAVSIKSGSGTGAGMRAGDNVKLRQQVR